MALPVFQRSVVTDTGNIIPNAQVTVTDTATGGIVTLFADSGGSTGLSNPFNATSEGFARFYANPGVYNVTATGAQGTIQWTDVHLIDSADIITIGQNFAAVETTADNIQAIIDAPQAATNASNSATAAANSATAAEGFKDDAETAAASVNAQNIVHAPGTGLPNEAGTAYNKDVTTSPTDTTAGRLLQVGAGGNQLAADIGRTGAQTVGTQDASNFAVKTNNIERARVTSTGNVLVGTTTDNGVDKLQVNGGTATTTLTLGAMQLIRCNKVDNSGGASIFQSVTNAPQTGELHVVELDTGNYLIASLYKKDAASSPVVTIKANAGLGVAATNTIGTIQLTGHTVSSNVRMKAFIYQTSL
jgi:hypothetical protein